jgi:hypothetical protein
LFFELKHGRLDLLIYRPNGGEMIKLLGLFSFLLIATTTKASMSDIDQEVREAISDELGENPDDIHSLRFVEPTPGCLFVVEAKVADQACQVCFEGKMQDPYASTAVCERLWLFEDEEDVL